MQHFALNRNYTNLWDLLRKDEKEIHLSVHTCIDLKYSVNIER